MPGDDCGVMAISIAIVCKQVSNNENFNNNKFSILYDFIVIWLWVYFWWVLLEYSQNEDPWVKLDLLGQFSF